MGMNKRMAGTELPFYREQGVLSAFFNNAKASSLAPLERTRAFGMTPSERVPAYNLPSNQI
jgi:hypothetical protein